MSITQLPPADDRIAKLTRRKPVETAAQPPPLMVTLGHVRQHYVSKPYLISGLFQLGYLYSMTAPPSAGKTAISVLLAVHVATGFAFHGHKVRKSKVLYLVGENQDDVQARFIKQVEEFAKIHGAEFNAAEVDTQVIFINKVFDLTEEATWNRIKAEAATHGPFGLVIVDTSPAYFYGSNENDNTQMIAHARALRKLLDLSGNPMVLALCHPPMGKDADKTMPRGGSGFMAEMDGNTYLQKLDNITSWWRHDKFRGRQWNSMAFELCTKTSELLKDDEGNEIPTVIVEPVSDSRQAERMMTTRNESNQVLLLIKEAPGLSQADMARKLKWFMQNREPNKVRIGRRIAELKQAGLIKEDRNVYRLTPAGEKAAKVAMQENDLLNANAKGIV